MRDRDRVRVMEAIQERNGAHARPDYDLWFDMLRYNRNRFAVRARVTFAFAVLGSTLVSMDLGRSVTWLKRSPTSSSANCPASLYQVDAPRYGPCATSC